MVNITTLIHVKAEECGLLKERGGEFVEYLTSVSFSNLISGLNAGYHTLRSAPLSPWINI